MFFKKKTETKGAVSNGGTKFVPTAGPQPAVEIPPAAPAPVAAKVEPAPAPAAAPASAAPAGPNALRNGDFSTWSKGDKFLAINAPQPTADHWMVGFGPGSVKSVNVSRGTPPPSQSGSALTIEVVEPGDGGGWFVLNQTFPDVRTLAGKSIEVSFWAQSTFAEPVAVGFIQNLGPDTPRVAVWERIDAPPRTWKHYRIPLDIPAVDAQTKPEGTSAFVELSLPKGIIYTLAFAGFVISEKS